MTKEKKFFRFDDIETTSTNEAESYSADRNQRGPAANAGFLNSLVEGYALYAAAVYPPLFQANEIARQRDVALFRNAANEERAVDNLDAGLDDDVSDLTDDSRPAANPAGEKSIALRVLGVLGSALLIPYRFIQREREIGRAISMLSAMDDRSLRDIGLHRSQIEHMVRYGADMD